MPFRCSRRDRSPGACNGCPNRSHCRFDKYQYCPEDAQMDYRSTLVDSRQGVNLTVQEAKEMADIVGSLLRQGQSPYQIIQSLVSLKRRSTTISKAMSFMRLQALLLWIFALRYLGRSPKTSQKGIKSGKIVNSCGTVPIRTISECRREPGCLRDTDGHRLQ